MWSEETTGSGYENGLLSLALIYGARLPILKTQGLKMIEDEGPALLLSFTHSLVTGKRQPEIRLCPQAIVTTLRVPLSWYGCCTRTVIFHSLLYGMASGFKPFTEFFPPTPISPSLSQGIPRQNVYACARLSISGLFFSHTFQSDQSLPRAPCVQRVVQLFCFMLPVLLTIL